jgi:hypothetical protein
MEILTHTPACDHSWSIEGWIQSKRRNRLSQELFERLLRTHTNLVTGVPVTLLTGLKSKVVYDIPVLDLSLSLHRHRYLYIAPSFLFMYFLINNIKRDPVSSFSDDFIYLL